MGIAHTSVIGTWPIITSRAWETAYSFLLAFRLRECPRTRTNVRYIDYAAGSDSNDGLTTSTPWKTLAKIQSSLTTDTMYLLKRGSVWEETTGLSISTANVTVADYGTGNKPLLNCWTTKYTSTGWSAATGDRYTRTEASDVAWVRDTSDRLAIAYQRFAPLSSPSAPTLTGSGTGGTLSAATYNYKVVALGINSGQTIPSTNATVAATTTGSTSRVTVAWAGVAGATGYAIYGRTAGSELLIATVSSSTLSYIDTGSVTPSGALPVANDTAEKAIEFYPLSYYYDASGTTLHINSGAGVSPNTKNLEAVVSNSNSGVQVSANGCRIENIRADGWGCHRTTTATQAEGIKSILGSTNSAVFVGCESYYSSSHAMAHFNGSGSGGIATFIRCKAGYTKYNGSAGETIFNTFSLTGGFETIFHQCEAVYGTLPSSEWYSATQTRRGRAFFGHTTTGTANLVVVYECRVTANAYGCSNAYGYLGTAASSALTDVRGYIIRPVLEDAEGTGNGQSLAAAGQAVIGARLGMTPSITGTGALIDAPVNGFFIDSIVTLNTKNQTIDFGFWNALPSNPSTITMDHCLFSIKGSSVHFTFDRDANQSDGSYLRNSVVQKAPGSGSGLLRLGLSNDAAKLVNNAYYGVSSLLNGYSNDAGKVELTDPLDLWHKPDPSSPLYRAGNASIRVEQDALGLPRDTLAPDIGPISRFTPAGAI